MACSQGVSFSCLGGGYRRSRMRWRSPRSGGPAKFPGGVDAAGDPARVSLLVGYRKASARTRRQSGSAASVAVSASGNPVRPHSHPGTCHAPTSARREACPAHLHSKAAGVWQEHKPPSMRHGRDVGWSGSRHGQHSSTARTRSLRVTSHLDGFGEGHAGLQPFPDFAFRPFLYSPM